MTDITELAQREKFEAWWEREYKHLESSKYTDAVPHIKYGFWMAYQAGGAELVEALEKAQQHENEWKSLCEAAAVDLDDWREIDDKSRDLLCKLADTVIAKAEQSAEWERKAISNFEDCAEMSARLEELESQRKLAFAASNRWADKFREAEKRITELESRAVTVGNLQESAYRAGLTAGWNLGLANNNDGFNKCLAAHTAGIKVEQLS
ncbi:hypothetical protein K1S16_28295 [Klebsiella pneumoniae]|uniref:hypothetical protein n=1 Tax=Klebsiella pneumoniae TaxID=573 RepID=UPI001CE2104E|nr:hypothetical protein [Klebsiella pneumoniae]MCA5536553.1 hypothetical protein [Klebsiella pneumoniae]MEB2425557.1 hypothetical protein [Klebsiella pneumoniae]